MKRYIFLDIDGVLNTDRHQFALHKKGAPTRDDLMPYFDPEAVENLRQIVKDTEADIIITSSWRHKGLTVMEEVWASRAMPGFVVDVTPTVTNSFFCVRGMEILKWLAENAPEEYRHAIIDDGDDFLPEQREHLVRTNPHCGISQNDIEKVIKILQ